MVLIDRRRALRATLCTFAGPAFAGCSEQDEARNFVELGRVGTGWISVFDPRFSGGAKGDGVTDDTSAISAAAAAAASSGRPLHMIGTFAVANLRLPGLGGFLHIFGDPILVQARPNIPCVVIEDRVLQQSLGCRLTCTVVPHPDSAKNNRSNVAINLTGFSSSDILIRLGKAARHTAESGRFHTVVYADAASPFHYGNRIRVIANAVPAPRYCIHYANRNRGVSGNPNINILSGWFNALDTVAGDVLIHVADTTQTIIEGPTLIEACPHATGIRLGNFTTVRDLWFEQVGLALDCMPTRDTVPNNCRVERCHFSGSGHFVRISNAVEARPAFIDCIGDTAVTFRDQAGKSVAPGARSRPHLQPAVPTLRFLQGGGRIVPDQASLRRGVDHYGRTTYQLRYFVLPESTGEATMRISPPAAYQIESAVLGIRDAAGRKLAWALGDDLAGGDYDWTWTNTSQHVLNIRVTLFSLA